MKRLLLLTLGTLCAAFCSTALGQGNVTDGLFAWYAFEGNSNNEIAPQEVELVTDVEFVLAQDGESQMAVFNGSSSKIELLDENPQFCLSQDFTIACRVQKNEGSGFQPIISRTRINLESTGYFLRANDTELAIALNNDPPGCGPACNWATILPIDLTEEVKHIAVTRIGNTLSVYVDGEIAQVANVSLANGGSLICSSSQKLFLGHDVVYGTHLDGVLDDVALWDRGLSSDEVSLVFQGLDVALGCTDEEACNYNAFASLDDGSCVFPPVIALGEDIETCEDSVVLDAGEGFNFYQWSTGETTQTIVVTETGEYAVSASNVIDNNNALEFNGTDATGAPEEPILFGTESFSVSIDCKLNAFKGNDSEPYSYIIGHPLTQGTGDHGFKIQTAETSLNGGFQVHINDEGTTHFNVISFDNGMETNVELDQWYDLTMVVDRNNAQFSFFVDGILIETQTIHPDFGNVDHPNGMSLGVQSIHGSSLLNGDLDNLQIWDVALSAEEVAHWQTTVPQETKQALSDIGILRRERVTKPTM